MRKERLENCKQQVTKFVRTLHRERRWMRIMPSRQTIVESSKSQGHFAVEKVSQEETNQGSQTMSHLTGYWRALACLRTRQIRLFILLVVGIASISYVVNTNLSLQRAISFQDGRYMEDGNQKHSFQLENAEFINGAMSLVGVSSKGNQSAVMVLNVGSRQWIKLSYLMKDAEKHSFPWKPVKAKEVDCTRLFAGNQGELNRSQIITSSVPVVPLSSENITKLAGNCNQFRSDFSFINSSLTAEEENFPIAYSVLVFAQAEQVLKLLTAIYRPQNYYCIHVDSKAEEPFRKAMEAIASCFQNVFLSSRSVDVQWGTFTVLEPELICMQDLWQYKRWKYFINLTGQEFPLRTNYELVKILTAFNGANDLEGTVKRANKGRWEKVGAPPHGITPTKGSVHVVVNRDFVDYVLHNSIAQDFLNWTKRIDVPDEAFFSTLNHNPQLGIRGTYNGTPETHPVIKPFLTRFKNWGGYPFDYPCAGGKRVRLICILSVGDLPLLDKRPEMFANKFYHDYSKHALDCLAERVYNHTRDEFLGIMDFNTTFYENLSIVKNMVSSKT